MSDIQTVKSPTVDSKPAVVYHVTLASGMVVTSPSGFEAAEPETRLPELVPQPPYPVARVGGAD